MSSMRNWMLGAAMVAGAAALGAVPAQAAEFGVYVRGPVAYVPPCPGPGYLWVEGYYDGGYWVPGFWRFVGVRGPVYRYERDRYEGWDRDHDRYRDFDRDRHFDHDRRFDRDHFDRDRHFDRDHNRSFR